MTEEQFNSAQTLVLAAVRQAVREHKLDPADAVELTTRVLGAVVVDALAFMCMTAGEELGHEMIDEAFHATASDFLELADYVQLTPTVGSAVH